MVNSSTFISNSLSLSISIVIPLYNQLHYTRLCLESLLPTVDAGVQIILIDNGSSDGTAEYLAARTDVSVISNPVNLGCAAAWNQGVNASRSDYVVILNNDVILPSGWLEALVHFAEKGNFDVVSPAMREGEYNYDIAEYAKAFVARMATVKRVGVANGVCFMVKRQVFDQIGFFDEKFRIGQFEDSDFFRRATLAGFALAMTGSSFLHHFGSITQNSIRRTQTAGPYEEENRKYFRQKWRLTWWKRFVDRRVACFRNFIWSKSERLLHRHSLKEGWRDGRLYFS